jgi:phosphatidylinositol alpha-1,6-mannosyltransferase
MKALVLTTQVGARGGVQYAGRLLLRSLADLLGPGADVTLLSLRDRPADLAGAGFGGAYLGHGSRLRTLANALRLGLRRWDLVLLGHANLAPLVPLVHRRGGGPLVAVVYSLEAWRPLGVLHRRGLARADRVLYISAHSRALSEAANPWLAAVPGAVCHLGLLPSDQESGVRGQGAPEGRQSIARGGNPWDATGEGDNPWGATLTPGSFALSVGRMDSKERYKGHEEMIALWPRVQAQRPGLRLVLIGDGDDRPRLEALARAAGAAVEFLGAVDDDTRDASLRACRCFCLPARGEGFGLVYLEAMRLGKPVLAGSTDAGREVVVDGVTGRAVDPTNPDELLDGILDVSGARAEALGEAGRERFDEQFRYDRFLERFGAHLREVLPGGTAR